MAAINRELLRRKDQKLPLAILIHCNVWFSLVFALLIGRLVVEKRNFYYCSALQRSLLLPVFCIWLLAEIPRLYAGQKGVLRDKLPETASFLLLSFFPQVWTVAYLGMLQEIILPFDTALGWAMLAVLLLELVLAWRFLRAIIARQSAQFYRNHVG